MMPDEGKPAEPGGGSIQGSVISDEASSSSVVAALGSVPRPISLPTSGGANGQTVNISHQPMVL